MATTVLIPPQTTALCTYQDLKTELKLTSDTDQAYYESLILESSAAIETYCGRTFARQQVQESHPGYGDDTLQLDLTPTAQIHVVLYKSDVVAGYVLEDAERGWLRLDAQWQHTGSWHVWLTGTQYGYDARRDYYVTLTGGYLLPGDDRMGAYSVQASDQSFNDAAGDFPILVAGDRVTSHGFLQQANNDTWTVVSCTASKLIVSHATAALVDEPASAADDQQLLVCTLPRDVRRAAMETVKAWQFSRGRDPTVRSRRIAEMAYQYDLDQVGTTPEVLPPRAISLLRPWVRVA